MKTVMISIYKKHNENIFDTLLKTEEIRKVKPKIDLPFKVVVYEPKKYGGCGKVIGEFIVDHIGIIECSSDAHGKHLQSACLTMDEFIDYCDGQDLYAWHISDLKVYDEPKELGEFRKPCGNCVGKCTGEHYDRCPWQTITRPPQSYMRIQDTKED